MTFSSPAYADGREEESFGAQMTFSGLPELSLHCCSYNCISTPMINTNIIMHIHMCIYIYVHR